MVQMGVVSVMPQSSERVLVCMNRFQNYESKIPDALGELGYEARWCDARPGNSFTLKFLIRLGILQHIRPLSRRNTQRIVAEAHSFGADTLLLISPENLRASQIKELRASLRGVRILLYFYDSSSNRYLDQEMIDSADAAYSFDMDDCDRYMNLKFIPLFHTHQNFVVPRSKDTSKDYNYCFIGTGRVRRVKVLARLARTVKANGSNYYFFLYAPSALQYWLFRTVATIYGYEGVLSRESMSFEKYLSIFDSSDCVIDIEQQNQGGLTIRTMDSVFAGSLLATSNRNVTRHDFFEHFPISTFSTDKLDIKVPKARQSALTEHFFHKYHIGHWLTAILTGEVPRYRVEEMQRRQ